MPGTRDDFTIMRLRVKGSNLDPLAVRPRLQNLIGEMSLRPLLPESASLFIRKLEDPSPGLLRLEATDSRANRAWQRSLNTRFAQLVRSAASPARGPVSSSAESVVFLDYSELLACLAADWCNGFAGARWWWHSFLQRGDIEQVVKKLWREKVEYVPAAMQQLAKTKVLVEFVATFSDRESRDLVERLAEKFALPAIRKVVELSPHDPLEAQFETSFSSSPAPVVVREKQVRSVAPWKYVVPESETSRLRPMQQLLLGVTLMIKRAPAQVRMRTFAREVEKWQSLVSVSLSAAIADESTPREMYEEPVQIDGPEEIEHQPQISRIETDLVVAAEDVETLEIEEARFTETAPLDVDSSEFDAASTVVHGSPRIEESSYETHSENNLQLVETEPAPQPFVERDESLTIDTELGGFFYLINLAIFLNIYSDFTSPVETFTELNIWDFVTLVGNELNEQQNDDDPIWSLLADLAGRDEEAFPPLREETQTWISSLMPGIRARLHRALGTDDLARVVCRHRARVNVTPTHIDVFFSLAELPIEIRLAGLDRDPGWVPAAGRFIAFHYE